MLLCLIPSPYAVLSSLVFCASLLQGLPLLRGVALRGPGVNGRDLSLKHSVHETMTCKHGLAFELRGDNYGLECLSTPAYTPACMISFFDLSEPADGNECSPERSSISTCWAWSWSTNLLFSESGVIPEVSAMAALTAANERAERENGALELIEGRRK